VGELGGFQADVEYLLQTLGPRITAVGCGVTHTKPLGQWRRGEAVPDALTRQRVDVLVNVTRLICDTYTGAVAAAFWRGANPELDDQSALLLVADAPDGAALRRVRADIMSAAEVLVCV